jgi:hypothetical protein
MKSVDVVARSSSPLELPLSLPTLLRHLPPSSEPWIVSGTWGNLVVLDPAVKGV